MGGGTPRRPFLEEVTPRTLSQESLRVLWVGLCREGPGLHAWTVEGMLRDIRMALKTMVRDIRMAVKTMFRDIRISVKMMVLEDSVATEFRGHYFFSFASGIGALLIPLS